MMIELYPHNQQAYENAKFVFETENKTAIVHATGTGKSLIIAKFIIDNHITKCLFISPNNFIHQEIKKHIKGFSKNVDFTTYHNFLFNSVNSFVNYDYIFLDEFHRAGAEEWNKQIIELIVQNPNAKILGTSATHIRYLDNERNMAEELLNGNVSSYMTLGDAIEKKILEKPIYVSALYNISEIIEETKKRLAKHNRKKHLDNLKSKQVIWEKSNGVDFIINKYLTADRKKILVFCKSIEHIDFVKNLIIPIFDKFYDNNIQYSYVHTGIGKKNLKTFKNFSSSDIPQVLFSVDMLNEGVHVKGVDTIMMFRDTVSPIIYFQQMGRCFAVGQKLQPLIFDFVNNFNIKNSINLIVQNFYNNFNLHNEEDFYIKRNLIIDFYDETLDFQNFIKEFAHFKTWEENYEELKKFVEVNNRFPFQSENNWVNMQKYHYKHGRISIEKINLLKELDKDFFEVRKILTWEDSFEEYKISVQKFGKVPIKNEKLYAWLQKQKQDYSNNLILDYRKELLLSVNKDFFEDYKELTWLKKYNEFKAFYNGNITITENSLIYVWLKTQRKNFIKNKLSEEKIKMLLEIDENILLSQDEYYWNSKYQELEKFVDENNRLPTINEFIWLNTQRKLYRSNQLPFEKIQKLLILNQNIFEARVNTWNDSFEEWKSCFNKNKAFSKKINTWISNQKSLFSKNKLPKYKIHLIEEINKDFFSFRIFDWEDSFEVFRSFYIENKRIPKQRESGWIFKQRSKFQTGELSKVQISKIDNLLGKDFLRKGISIPKWEESYQKLKNFVEENNRLPTINEFNWVASQRQKYTKNQLTSLQIELLEKIDKGFFEIKYKTWEENYEELKKFVEVNNRLPTNKEFSWYFLQKHLFKKGGFSKDRLNLLLKIDPNFILVKKMKTWEENYQELKIFINKNNRLPTQKESHFINTMRNYKRLNKLSQDKIDKLIKLDKNFFY